VCPFPAGKHHARQIWTRPAVFKPATTFESAARQLLVI
jgi:hypothetical protein